MDYFTPILQYVVSPVAIVGTILWFLSKSFNLGKIIEKINDTSEDVSKLKEDTKQLLNHVNIMKTHLVTSSGLDANLFAPGSPLKLLKKGEALLKKSKFKNVYKDDKNWFLEKIKTFDVDSLADIDEASIHILEECRDTDNFLNFKEVSFNNGVTQSVLLRVLAIYLRNELAKELKFN